MAPVPTNKTRGMPKESTIESEGFRMKDLTDWNLTFYVVVITEIWQGWLEGLWQVM